MTRFEKDEIVGMLKDGININRISRSTGISKREIKNLAERRKLKLEYRVQPGCFLSIAAKGLYSRVVMNPPFEKQADIDHVLHAWNCVVPGGRLVAIMPASVAFRENSKTVGFRELLDRHGYMERNPAGAFKASGTMVNTVTVVMDKP